MSDTSKRVQSFVDKALEVLGSIFSGLGKILSKGLGIFFGILALGLLVGLVASVVSPESAVNVFDNTFSLAEIRELIFHGNTNFYLSVIGGLLLTIVPIIGLIYAAIRILAGGKVVARGLGTTLFILFILGAVATTTGVIRTVHGYHEEGEAEKLISIPTTEDELHVMILPDDEFHSSLNIDNDYLNYWEVMKLTEGELINGREIEFETRESKSDDFKLKIRKESQGGSSLQAIHFSEHIEYDYSIEGDTLYLAPYFKIPREDGFRAQRVELMLYVPDMNKISLDHNTSRIELRGMDRDKTYIYEDGYRLDYEKDYLIKKQEADSLKKPKLQAI